MSEFVLSPFQPSHATEVVAWVRSLVEARAWSSHAGASLPTASIFETWHREPDDHPYLLTLDSVPVAYGEIWPDRAAAEIELARLIVRPDVRGLGIGRRLVEELIAESAKFESAGFTFESAYVRVVPDNEIALACYCHSGFARVPDGDEKRFNEGQPTEYAWLRRQLRNARKSAR